MSSRSAPRRWRPLLVLVALLALVAPLAGCGGSTLGAGTAVGPVPSPELRQFYAQRLDWSRCGRFDCTYLEVPLDYSRPTGRTARLAVLRSRAGQPDRRIGSLVVNPGGPGGSGTELAAGLADQVRNTPLGERFDLVGFDPRGIGSSEPLIKCSTGRERDDDRLYRDTDDAPPPGETAAAAAERTRARDAHYEEETKGDVAKCVDRSGADLLANVGTRDVARDMDVLRSALGDAKLTYLGYSYGTRLGYTYAEAFPGNVRPWCWTARSTRTRTRSRSRWRRPPRSSGRSRCSPPGAASSRAARWAPTPAIPRSPRPTTARSCCRCCASRSRCGTAASWPTATPRRP
ncbi:MAG TPA: alpha/beta fold hydrolase [Pseudonocardia sp.]|nr:alpha/beta fold hydrolase [Pseudonocardia sp.]